VSSTRNSLLLLPLSILPSFCFFPLAWICPCFTSAPRLLTNAELGLYLLNAISDCRQVVSSLFVADVRSHHRQRVQHFPVVVQEICRKQVWAVNSRTKFNSVCTFQLRLSVHILTREYQSGSNKRNNLPQADCSYCYLNHTGLFLA
jgi:hypothetical protein